jgi:hypothetical protein
MVCVRKYLMFPRQKGEISARKKSVCRKPHTLSCFVVAAASVLLLLLTSVIPSATRSVSAASLWDFETPGFSSHLIPIAQLDTMER